MRNDIYLGSHGARAQIDSKAAHKIDIYIIWADIRLPRHSNVNRSTPPDGVRSCAGIRSAINVGKWQTMTAIRRDCLFVWFGCWRVQLRKDIRFRPRETTRILYTAFTAKMETHIFEHISPRIRPTHSHSYRDHLHIFQHQSAFFARH